MDITRSYLKDLVYKVNGAAIEVHRSLGPGLLESVYHKCMLHELKWRGIKFQSEGIVPINYKGLDVEAELRCDILVEDILIVELKSVAEIKPIFEAQILTYMNLFNSPIGLLINFNVTHIFKEGQKTYINRLYNELWEYTYNSLCSLYGIKIKKWKNLKTKST